MQQRENSLLLYEHIRGSYTTAVCRSLGESVQTKTREPHMHHDDVLPLPAPTRKHVAYLYSFAFLRRIQFKGNRALKPLSETVSKRHGFHVSAWLKQP